MHNLKRKLAIYSSYVVSLVFLYLTLEGIDYAELTKSLKLFEVSSILIACLVYLSTFMLRGLRISLILDGEANIEVSVSSGLIAYALNNFIPLKGGDIYKIYFLNRYAKVRKSVSTASVIIERLFDLAAVLLVFLLMIYFLNLDTATWKISSLVYVIVGLLVVLSAVLYFTNKFKHINIERYIGIANPDSLHVFMECWGRLLTHRHFGTVFRLSLMIWMAEGFVFYVIMDYGSLSVAFIWMSTLALSFVIPNAPGNIGLFEWVSIFVLTKFGFGAEHALSLGLIAHLIQFASVTLVGLILYMQYKQKA